MKNLRTTSSVDFAIHTLGPDEGRRIRASVDSLRNWDTDANLRRISTPLVELPGKYIMCTNTDMRIFFRIDGDTITILDVAGKSAILATGHTSGVN